MDKPTLCLGIVDQVVTGWLSEPETRPYWPALLDLLSAANPVPWEDGHLCWIASDGGQIIGAVTTRLMVDGNADLMCIAGTRVREWYPQLEAQICEWARKSGAKTIYASGRRGWVPLVTKLGWTVTGSSEGRTLFEKEL